MTCSRRCAAPEVCARLVAAIDSGKYDLVVVNFANPDMVGHTGILEAAIKACETVDGCAWARVEAAVRREAAAPCWSPPTMAMPS